MQSKYWEYWKTESWKFEFVIVLDFLEYAFKIYEFELFVTIYVNSAFLQLSDTLSKFYSIPAFIIVENWNNGILCKIRPQNFKNYY